MNCLKVLTKTKLNPLKAHKCCPQVLSLQKRFNNTRANDNHTIDGLKSDPLDTIGCAEECLIYSGPQNMIKMIKTIKTFSISTTLIASGVQPFIFQQILSSNSSAFAIGFTSLTSIGIVMSPLVLNWFTKRYVTQLYYNNRTHVFTAWTLNLLNRRSSTQYKASDVLVPEVLGMFTTYTVGPKRRAFFVDPESVTDFRAYKSMLGYDKPLDLSFDKVVGHQNESKTK